MTIRGVDELRNTYQLLVPSNVVTRYVRYTIADIMHPNLFLPNHRPENVTYVHTFNTYESANDYRL
jgi:hypothetical protein